jgi:hypothetical protein
MVVISGQVKTETLLSMNPVTGLRQLGDQEVDIVPDGEADYKMCAFVAKL